MSHFRAPGRYALLAARRASPALHQTRNRLYATRPPKSNGGGGFLRFVALFGGAAAAGYYFRDYFAKETDSSSSKATDTQIAPAELQFEEKPKQLSTKEETRDSLSSQHLQVKQSWESPGVYAWGSNASLVVDPTASSDKPVKAPKRISYFDGQLLRDLKLAKTFGVAVTEKGDLVQWGTGFSKANPAPAVTLKGADITKVGVSADRVIALSSKGRVFSIPASKDDLETGSKLVDDTSKSSSWMSFWSSSPFSTSVSARDLTPPTLSRGEKIVDISSGVDHCLMLSSKGRVFSSAASTTDFPSKGQMGIPGLSWATRPHGAYDQPHEIATLSGFDITDIATGDYHSAALDKEGKIFTFGDNTFGQLGFTSEPGFQSIDVPSLLPIGKLYANSGLVPRITSVAAGGDNTFFTVDARAPERQGPDTALSGQQRPRVAADLWACGKGLAGSLGNGRWTHVTPGPTKVKALSSLFEFDERSGAMVPIRLAYLAVGGTHAGAVLANVTHSTAAAAKAASSVADTNWGADVLFWGGNESWQLGSGKRTNVNAPMYIAPLEREGAAGDHRLQLTPRRTVRIGEGGSGRKATLEQRLVCGPNATAVYSKT